jgi:thioesterase domain-containing protein
MYKVLIPKTDEQLTQYYHFRWRILREPFNFPPGSEKDEYDAVAQHRMLLNHENQIVAVGRVHFNTSEEVQIRHIAVDFDQHGKGLGRIIIAALENYAIGEGATRAVTNSLETSEAFFSSCGYVREDSAPNDLTKLKRIHMVKQLGNQLRIVMHPKWCQELQSTWQNTIPISEQMGIQVYQYDGLTFEVRASLNKNVNLHGTMFAGSIYSLATLTGWGLIHLQLKQRGLGGDIVLGDGNIHYHKPVTSQPRGLVDVDALQGDFGELQQRRKARFDVQVNILDGHTQVAEFTGIYWVLPSATDPQI